MGNLLVHQSVDESAPMISPEHQYKYITKRLSDMSKATYDGLKLFLPMFSAIVAGSVWLSQQAKSPIPHSYAILSDLLVLLLTIVCSSMTVMNLISWRAVTGFY